MISRITLFAQSRSVGRRLTRGAVAALGPTNLPGDRFNYNKAPRLDAFVQIEHKRHWYYVADSDPRSKRTFALLTHLYALQASDVSDRVPLLTVPLSP